MSARERVEEGELLWTPPPRLLRESNLARYLAWLEAERGLRFDDYHALWRWSVDDLEAFWGSIWDRFDVISDRRPPHGCSPIARCPAPCGSTGRCSTTPNTRSRAMTPRRSPSASATRPGTRSTSRAANSPSGSAPRARDSDGWASGKAIASPRTCRTGSRRSSRFLATASLGAVWSSCSPDFGARAVVDRFRQIEPKVLVAVDGYRYGGEDHDRRGVVAEIAASLTGLERLVVVPGLDERPGGLPNAASWDDAFGGEARADVRARALRSPAVDPLLVGHDRSAEADRAGSRRHPARAPEGARSALDLGPDDRFFWFTTTGWMMWNFLVGGLLVGSTVVLYDGSPAHPDLGALWRLAAETSVTYFGTSAPYLLACKKRRVRPRETRDLSALRAIGTTGAPLPPTASAGCTAT